MKGLSIVGSSRINGDREANDFYPTPQYCVHDLLERESFSGIIREPACGDGAISKVLESNGYSVISTDIVHRGYGVGNVDFLDKMYSGITSCDCIITNPPYSLGLEFVNRSKEVATNKIAMFLKTVFLESELRKEMFLDNNFPLKAVYQYSKRVTLSKGGVKLKNSGMIAYAWYVWEKSHVGKPFIDWI